MTRSYGATPSDGRMWMIGKTTKEIMAIVEEAQATGKTYDEVVQTDEWRKRLSPPEE